MNRPRYIEETLQHDGAPPFRPRFAHKMDDAEFPDHILVPGIGWVVASWPWDN